jgi:hypothetical protein
LRINGTGRGRGETGDERDEEKDIYTVLWLLKQIGESSLSLMSHFEKL